MRDGWIETKLGQYIHINTGKLDVNAASEFGDYPFFTCSRETYRIDEAAFEGESVLVAGNGDLNVKYYDGKFNAYQRTYVLNSVDRKILDNRFLFLFMQTYIEYLRSETRGTVIQYLKKGQFTDAKIKLPPLPQQKRIVDLISSVDSYIEALQQQLESAKRSRNAVLHELLTACGDDWVEHKLIDMFEIYQPQTIAKSLMSADGKFIVFGANGPIGRYHEFNHEEPEVVVTCRGATCGTINMTPPKTWITGNAMVVSPKTSEVSKEFLYWALVAGADIKSVISGSAQPQITREGLAPVKIKIPPLSRQEEIVDLISGFELNISHLEESLNKTKTLRSGLLSDLLSGDHEIPDSYDKIIGAA